MWMVSDVDFLQGFDCLICDREYKKLSPFIGVNTSFALSLLAWISDASISYNSSMSAIILSPFQIPPHTIHNRGIYLARLLGQIDVISICPSQK